MVPRHRSGGAGVGGSAGFVTVTGSTIIISTGAVLVVVVVVFLLLWFRR